MARIIPILLLFISFNMFSQIDSKQYFENSKQLFTEKKYDIALASVDNALKIDSLNRNYLIHKINILFNDSKCNDAMKVLNKVYEINNEKVDDEIMVFFTTLYDCFGEKEKATKILKSYIDDKQYQNDEMIINLAQRLMNEQDYENASLYYKEYVLLKPHDIDAIIDLTRILYAFKSSDEAIKEVSKGLENNRNNIRLLTYLASCYHNNKDYDKAIEIMNQIIKLEYKAENIASRAMLYELLGEKDKAYEDNKVIVSLLKCNSEYYFKVLQYEFENKLYEKVIENSYKLIECSTTYENSILDGLYTSLFFIGDFEKGKLYLDKKLASNPNNINPYYIKSLLLLKSKQYDEVLKYLDLAVKCKDVDKTDVVNINTVKFGYYLSKEDYQGFVNYFNSGDVKTLDNNLNFTFIEDSKSQVTEIKTDFNKKTGTVNSSIIIPTKVFRLLEHKYGLKIELEK
jgi:tetratricopeptide (TPR) repeat protein